MDADLRDALAGLSGQMSNVASDAREAASRSREAAAQAGRAAAGVARVETRVATLEAVVFGPSGPPAGALAPVVARMSESEFGIDSLTARVILIEGEMSEQTKLLRRIDKTVSGVVRSPMVKRIALACGTVLLLWLASVQARLQIRSSPAAETAQVHP